MAVLTFPTREMWRRNLVVNGVGTCKYYQSPPATLSLKAVLRGQATYRSNGRSYTVDEDLLLILGCGDSYVLEVDTQAPSETFGIFFRPGFVESHAAPFSESGMAPRNPILPRIFARDQRHDAIIRSLKNAEDSSTTDEMEREIHYHKAALLMVDEGDRARSEQSCIGMNPAIRDEMVKRLALTRDMILQDPSKAWTLEALAETAFLSAFHFHRLFSKLYGVTPHTLLSNERLRRAHRLLVSTELSIAEVALRVGLANAPSLHRLHKRAYGTSPRKGQILKSKIG